MLIFTLREYIKIFETYCVSSSEATDEEVRDLDKKISDLIPLVEESSQKKIWLKRYSIARNCLLHRVAV